jgi:hypothetical protein
VTDRALAAPRGGPLQQLPKGLRVLCASSQAPSRARRRGGAHPEGSAGPQLVQIRQTDTGQRVEKVGLGGMDVGGSLGACA